MSAMAENVLRRHRLTVEEYYRMAETGILRADDRVELIEGEIVDMVPTGSRHAGNVEYLAEMLRRAVGPSAFVRVQNPIRLNPYSELQPDLAVVRPRADFYKTAHPQAADVFLVVEVAESSLAFDRDIKAPLYARHGIPEMGLVDLDGRQLHVFTSPGAEAYSQSRAFASPGLIPLTALPACAVDLSALF